MNATKTSVLLTAMIFSRVALCGPVTGRGTQIVLTGPSASQTIDTFTPDEMKGYLDSLNGKSGEELGQVLEAQQKVVADKLKAGMEKVKDIEKDYDRKIAELEKLKKAEEDKKEEKKQSEIDRLRNEIEQLKRDKASVTAEGKKLQENARVAKSDMGKQGREMSERLTKEDLGNADALKLKQVQDKRTQADKLDQLAQDIYHDSGAKKADGTPYTHQDAENMTNTASRLRADADKIEGGVANGAVGKLADADRFDSAAQALRKNGNTADADHFDQRADELRSEANKDLVNLNDTKIDLRANKLSPTAKAASEATDKFVSKYLKPTMVAPDEETFAGGNTSQPLAAGDSAQFGAPNGAANGSAPAAPPPAAEPPVAQPNAGQSYALNQNGNSMTTPDGKAGTYAGMANIGGKQYKMYNDPTTGKLKAYDTNSNKFLDGSYKWTQKPATNNNRSYSSYNSGGFGSRLRAVFRRW